MIKYITAKIEEENVENHSSVTSRLEWGIIELADNSEATRNNCRSPILESGSDRARIKQILLLRCDCKSKLTALI